MLASMTIAQLWGKLQKRKGLFGALFLIAFGFTLWRSQTIAARSVFYAELSPPFELTRSVPNGRRTIQFSRYVNVSTFILTRFGFQNDTAYIKRAVAPDPDGDAPIAVYLRATTREDAEVLVSQVLTELNQSFKIRGDASREVLTSESATLKDRIAALTQAAQFARPLANILSEIKKEFYVQFSQLAEFSTKSKPFEFTGAVVDGETGIQDKYEVLSQIAMALVAGSLVVLIGLYISLSRAWV